MPLLRRFALATAATLVMAVGWAVTSGAHPAHPASRDAALRDGCQRSDFGIGFDTSPEWVFVHRSPAIRKASGIVRVSHASLEDSILQHRSYDYNGNLVPDPAYRYLIAGTPSSKTNNYSPGGGEEQGRLHFEWESATLPFFAWPSDGDRATLWGSWIWDCGHWQSGSENNTGTTITGERSELHPLDGIVVTRRASYLSARGERETDVFISNEGDGAHAVEQCALRHHPTTGAAYPQYDAGFKPCATSVANRLQPLEPHYTFFVPAPPKPSATARLRYRIVSRIARGSGTTKVRLRAHGLLVTVRLRNAKHVVRYGKSFFVSWSGGIPHRPTLLRVTFQSILIKQADSNPSDPDPSGAHWALYLDLNGYWQLLNNWIPSLSTHVTDGEQIKINRTVKIYVPHGSGLSLLVQGRECDEPAGKTVFGVYANLLYPCPANTDEQNPNILDVFSNDDTGTILTSYRSARVARGAHVGTSAATVNFSGTGPISFGNVPQGNGAYQLKYTIR